MCLPKTPSWPQASNLAPFRVHRFNSFYEARISWCLINPHLAPCFRKQFVSLLWRLFTTSLLPVSTKPKELTSFTVLAFPTQSSFLTQDWPLSRMTGGRNFHSLQSDMAFNRAMFSPKLLSGSIHYKYCQTSTVLSRECIDDPGFLGFILTIRYTLPSSHFLFSFLFLFQATV